MKKEIGETYRVQCNRCGTIHDAQVKLVESALTFMEPDKEWSRCDCGCKRGKAI